MQEKKREKKDLLHCGQVNTVFRVNILLSRLSFCRLRDVRLYLHSKALVVIIYGYKLGVIIHLISFIVTKLFTLSHVD